MAFSTKRPGPGTWGLRAFSHLMILTAFFLWKSVGKRCDRRELFSLVVEGYRPVLRGRPFFLLTSSIIKLILNYPIFRIGHGVPKPVISRPRATVSGLFVKNMATPQALPEVYGGPRGAGEIKSLAKWAERELVIPSGLRAGKPFKLAPWQLRFLRAAWRSGRIESGLCCARKNGKTGLIAVLILAHLVGPLRRFDWRGLVASASKHLTSELGDAVRLTAQASGLWHPDLLKFTTRSSSCDAIEAPGTQSRCELVTASSRTGHSSSLDLAILDEAGLLTERQRGLWEAVQSSISARRGRLLAVGIRSTGPMFAEMLEDQGASYTHVEHFSAALSARLDDPEAWKAANPGLGPIKALSYLRQMSKRALNRPRVQQSFRELELNLPVSAGREPLLSVAEWLSVCCDPADLPPRAGPCVVALDLGGSRSQSAMAAGWPETGRLESLGCFPLIPDLAERGRADGVGPAYVDMKEAGELVQFGQNLSDVGAFLGEVKSHLDGQEVLGLWCDRYRKAELLEYVEAAGIPWPLVFRGQGAGRHADGSYDVRALHHVTENRMIFHRRSLLVETALAGSEIARDSLGNPKLSRADRNSRVDVLSCLLMVCGQLRKMQATPEREPQFFVA